MGTAVQVPLSEYLATDYSPDVDYVDGALEERNVGEQEHSWLQTMLAGCLLEHRKQLGVHVFVELRLRITDSRYRVPDIAVFSGEKPVERVPSVPPFLCIEILSPEDRMTRVQARIRDYLTMGVRHVWIIDPSTRSGWMYTPEGATEARDGVFSAGTISVILDDLD